MYTERDFENLENEENKLTLTALALMLMSLGATKNDIIKEVTNFYRKYGKDGIVTYNEARKFISEKNHKRRITNLYLTNQILFDGLLKNLKPYFKSMLTEIIEKESDFFNKEVSIERLLATKWGFDELNWLDRLKDDIVKWQALINADVKTEILKQSELKNVIESIEKRFNTFERGLEKLTITESSAMGSIVRNRIFKKIGVSKYKYYAVEDERTCQYCGALHGKIFPMSAYEVGVTASPIHPFADALKCQSWTR